MLLFMNSARAQQPASNSSKGADANSYTQYGLAAAAKGDLNGATAAFNQALQIDPKYVPAYYNRAQVHAMQKDYDDAVSDYGRVIEIDPNNSSSYYERGSIEGMNGNFDAAINDLKQVIKLDPKFTQAYYNLGHVYYFRGNLDDALDQLNQALILQPDFALSYFMRGLVRHAQGHQIEAQGDFQRSAGLNFPYATFWLWVLQTENGHRGLARQNLVDALAKPEMFSGTDWPSQIANFLLEKIPQDQLVSEAGQGPIADSKDRLCEAWFYAGIVKHFAGDDKGATECYNKAIATDAKSSEEYVEANRLLAQVK